MTPKKALIFIFIILSLGAQAQNQLTQTKTETLFAKGNELVDHSNYVAAREMFSQFLEEAPKDDARRVEAEYYVAFCALNLQHLDGEKLIDDFINNNPASPRAATAYYDLATFFYNEKSYTKAIQYFKKVDFPALTIDNQNQGHFKWGYSLFNLRKLEEAREQFNFVKKQKSPYAPAANYYSGFIAYGEGKYDEALEDLKQAERSESYGNIVPYLIANIYYRQSKFDELIAYGDQAVKKPGVSNKEEISMLIADAYFFKKDYAKAKDAYQVFLEANKDRADAALLYRAGYVHYELGQTDKAIEYLSKSAATKDTVGYYASYYLGIMYLKKGDKPYALNAFEYASKSPSDAKLREESAFQFAKVAYDMGKPDLAISAFEMYLKNYPNSQYQVQIKELLAQAYINGNNYNKAIEYIEALPSRNPTMNNAYQKATYLKGAELFNKEEYAEAVAAFEKSLEKPGDPKYTGLSNFWIGEAYSLGKKYNEAALHYSNVIELGANVEPDILLQTRYGLGYAYYNLEQFDRALFNFKDFTNKTNRSNSNYTDALIRLADCYYVSKNYEEALKYYNQARNIGSPDNDYILFQSGVISGILRNYTESKNQFNALINNYPKSPYRGEAIYQRAQFDIEQGNYEVAVQGLSQLIREVPSSRFIPYAYMRRAASNYNLKKYNETVRDYEAVLKQFPTHPVAQDALLPLQEALGLMDRSDEFNKHLTEFKATNPENKGLEGVEFETAKNLFYSQQYQKAIGSFNNFKAGYPNSGRIVECDYFIAESYYRLKDFNQALPIYKSLSANMSFTQIPKAVARIAEIEYAQGNYANAVNSFYRLEKLADSKKELFNAWSGLMDSYYMLGTYDSVTTYANVILEKGNINAGAQNKASLYLGKAAMAKRDYETAKDEFLNTLNAARDEYGAEAKYLLAEIFYLTKEHTQCKETAIGVSNDFAAYDIWVGKAFLLLADNSLAEDDAFQAKATLESLIQHFPLQSIKDQAKVKLAEIEKENLKKETEIKADTLDNNR